MSTSVPNHASSRHAGPGATPPGFFGQIRGIHISFLLAGAVLGVGIGLVIGWVLAPVQWTNAWPTDLSPEARAQYLATVAESYAYYGDSQAAETARNRLYDLNADLPAQIAAAQAYFRDHPQHNSRVYISYLGQLAQALGAESPDIVMPSTTDSQAPGSLAPPDAPSAGESAAQDTNQADLATAPATAARTWVNWILITLAAVVLLGGGLYVISHLAAVRPTQYDDGEADEIDEFDDEAVPPRRTEDARSQNPFQPRRSPPGTPAGFVDARRAPSGFDAPEVDDYEFDDEAENSHVVYSSGTAIEDLDDFERDDIGVERPNDRSPSSGYSPDAWQNTVAPTVERSSAETVAGEPQPGVSSGPLHARQPTRNMTMGKSLGSYTAHYQAGTEDDYDQTFKILDVDSGKYIGDCGMGVNIKNGVLQTNPDHVIALDIWLYDKSTERGQANTSRVLLSEYVIDSKLEGAFTRERPNDPAPVVAQPGVSFQLKGQSLVLDCEIVDATYVKNGPALGTFQSVSVEMTVHSRE